MISLLTGAAKPDLLQIITTDSAPIIARCSERLTDAFTHSWVQASDEDAGVLARAIVRLAMSYVSMPPEADHDVAADLARLMTPFAERYGVIDTAVAGRVADERLSREPAGCGCRQRTRVRIPCTQAMSNRIRGST